MKRVILGNGEKYTIDNVHHPRKPNDNPANPYPFSVSSRRVATRVKNTLDMVNQLPDMAMPEGEFVAAVTLHPSFLAKSFYPTALFQDYKLVSLGSKEVFIKPDVGVNKAQKKGKVSSSVYFVAGKKESFERLLSDIESRKISESAGVDLGKIEDLRLFSSDEKIKSKGNEEESVYEVVLHLWKDEERKMKAFIDAIESLGGFIDKNKTRFVDGLSFCFVRISSLKINDLASFAFVRTVRVASKINLSNFLDESDGISSKELPDDKFKSFGNASASSNLYGLEQNSQVAVFDGGIFSDDFSHSNLRYFDLTSGEDGYSKIYLHGELVTSAVLYGAIDDPSSHVPEILNVDHYKVICEEDEDDVGLVNVLDRIVSVLSKKKYKIANICVGPEIPRPDDDPNLWTSTLDKVAADGDVLIFVAAGNAGGILTFSPEDEDLARIQPPADLLNGMSIGAANSRGEDWSRASYSCIGPGRRPGYIKPDVVFFGGDNAHDGEKVHLLGLSDYEEKKKFGTSFASPLVTRIAARLDNLTLGKLTPASLRALLIHNAESVEDRKGCGWGRVCGDVDQYIHCDDECVTIIYQGVLTKSAGVRAAIPCPSALKSAKTKVDLVATLCFYTDVDTNHPVSYSRAGIEVTFRPNSERFNIDKETGELSAEAASRSFFSKGNIFGGNEQYLRHDAHKWETCYKVEDTFMTSKLHDPCFDIKYLTRDEGHSLPSKVMRKLPELAYSLVVTLRVNKECGLYDAILNEYHLLQPIDLSVNATLEL
jgi:hypothetical protein